MPVVYGPQEYAVAIDELYSSIYAVPATCGGDWEKAWHRLFGLGKRLGKQEYAPLHYVPVGDYEIKSGQVANCEGSSGVRLQIFDAQDVERTVCVFLFDPEEQQTALDIVMSGQGRLHAVEAPVPVFGPGGTVLTELPNTLVAFYQGPPTSSPPFPSPKIGEFSAVVEDTMFPVTAAPQPCPPGYIWAEKHGEWACRTGPDLCPRGTTWTDGQCQPFQVVGATSARPSISASVRRGLTANTHRRRPRYHRVAKLFR